MGMHCLGCPASRGESLEQACMVHAIRISIELLKKLNDHIEKNRQVNGAGARPSLEGCAVYTETQSGKPSGRCRAASSHFGTGKGGAPCVRRNRSPLDRGWGSVPHSCAPVAGWQTSGRIMRIFPSARVPRAVRSAIAADVREGPLGAARRTIARCGVESLVTARLSDGLRAIRPEEADDIVIAGMGGELIARIVGEAPWLCTPERHLNPAADDLGGGSPPFFAARRVRRVREEAVREDNRVYSAMPGLV